MAGKMGVRTLIHCLLLSTVFATPLNYLFKRASTCTSIHAKSDNGNRKVAIVIDSSGSMTVSDPSNLRLSAGIDLTNWLISNKEATANTKADLVTVINFDTEAYLDYPLGDPGNADGAFNGIGADGGTFIAGGVQMGIDQILGGPAPTAQRSAIVVFTDGEDNSVSELVDTINNATSLGIRVSFGFLDVDGSQQDPTVLEAIGKSGGQYNTMYNDGSASNFINLVISNGITYDDNPTGTNSTLFSGMQTFRFITGSQTMSIQYIARPQERITFAIQSFNITAMAAEADLDNKKVSSTNLQVDPLSEQGTGSLYVTASHAGLITIKLTSQNASQDAMVLIAANSNLPAQNCTISIGSDTLGASTSPIPPHIQTAMAVAIPPVAGLIGILGFFLYKFLGAGAAAGAGAGAAAGGVGAGAGAAGATAGGVAAGGMGAGLGAGAGAGGMAYGAEKLLHHPDKSKHKHKDKRPKRRKQKKRHSEKCEKKCYKDEKKKEEHDKDIEMQRKHDSETEECDENCEYCDEDKKNVMHLGKQVAGGAHGALGHVQDIASALT